MTGRTGDESSRSAASCGSTVVSSASHLTMLSRVAKNKVDARASTSPMNRRCSGRSRSPASATTPSTMSTAPDDEGHLERLAEDRERDRDGDERRGPAMTADARRADLLHATDVEHVRAARGDEPGEQERP